MCRKRHSWRQILPLLILGFTGILSAQSVSLEWDPNSETDLAGYNVYRSSQSGTGYTRLNGSLLGSTSYTDSSVSYDQTYYYVCTAVNTSGLESGYSNEVSYTASAPNTAPVAQDDSVATIEDVGITVDVLGNDTDSDGDSLTVVSVTQPISGTASSNGNSVSYVPHADFFGNDSFTYTISDGSAQSTATVFLTVDFVNDLPEAVSDSATTGPGEPVSIAVLDNDSDVDGDSLSVSDVTQPANGTVVVQVDSSVVYTPAPGFDGSDSFSYTVSDGQGGTASAQVTVVVEANEPPTALDDSVSLDEDQSVTIDLVGNDSDPDGDPLEIVAVTQGSHGSIAVTSSTAVRYTPEADFNGTDSFSYTVGDGNGGSDTAGVTVTIRSVNDAPVAVSDGASTGFSEPVTIVVLGNDSDADEDPLSVSSVTQPSNGRASVQGDDSIVYTPDEGFDGIDSFSYTVSDGNGGSDTAQVSISVEANHSPSAVSDTADVDEDQSVTVDLVGNDSDPDGDPLEIVAVTQGSHGSISVTSSTAVRYTPEADFNGTDSFSYTVGDGNGGSDTAGVTVTIRSVNDAPVAADDTASVTEGESVTINLIANDSDVDGDSLAVQSVTAPAQGAVLLTSAESVTYTPAADYYGSDAFEYTVSDGNGFTVKALVTIDVTEANDAPVAESDSAITSEDVPVTIEVLANDSDADADTLVLESVSSPANGGVEISGSAVIYVPSADFHGSDSFGYTVSDGRGGSTSAQVTVTVSPGNDAPVARDDSAVTTAGSTVDLDLVANDEDVDGDLLELVSVESASFGIVSLLDSRQIRYVADADFSGVDSFQYQVTDGQETVTGRVEILIESTTLQTQTLFFPATLETGDSQLSSTFVGVGLLNPKTVPDQVKLSGVNSSGAVTTAGLLGSEIPAYGQRAFMAGEVMTLTSDTVQLSAEGQNGALQGFFMVGDTNSKRLDGVGAGLDVAEEIYFSAVSQTHGGDSTLIQVINPSPESAARLSMELRGEDGRLVDVIHPVIAPGGSFMGTLSELYGSATVERGYVALQSDIPVAGYQVVVNSRTMSSVAASRAEGAGTLYTPHFFVDSQGGNSVLRILNPSSQSLQAVARFYSDSGRLLGSRLLSVPANRLFSIDAAQILGLSEKNVKDLISGYLKLEVTEGDAHSFVGTVTFSGFRGRSETTVPLVRGDQREIVFPQVAQSADGSIYTGLAIANPNLSAADIRLEAVDSSGRVVRSKFLYLEAGNRIVDLLRSYGLLGEDFSQTGGHIRIYSSQPVASYAIFGDYKGEYLSTIEGQDPLAGY